MLHEEAVSSDLLLIAKKIFSLPWSQDFLLVGGTNLALQFGHRFSVDIDLFCNVPFLPVDMTYKLTQEFSIEENNVLLHEDGLTAYIQPGQIKIDLFHIDMNMNSDPVIENGLRLASLLDVAALKIEAMVQRRVKKDYIDLYFIFKYLEPQECLEHFHKLDRYCSPKSVAFALTEVDTVEVNKSEMPEMLIPVSWSEINDSFQSVASQYAKRMSYGNENEA